MLAVDGGHLDAARLLLDRGAAPDALNNEAIRLATRYARQDIVELLLLHGAAPAQGPPATLPSSLRAPSSDPALDEVSDKENVAP